MALAEELVIVGREDAAEEKKRGRKGAVTVSRS
jgi:hypothetical protein